MSIVSKADESSTGIDASGPEGPPSGVEPPLGWNLAQRKKTGFRIKSGMTTL